MMTVAEDTGEAEAEITAAEAMAGIRELFFWCINSLPTFVER